MDERPGDAAIGNKIETRDQPRSGIRSRSARGMTNASGVYGFPVWGDRDIEVEPPHSRPHASMPKPSDTSHSDRSHIRTALTTELMNQTISPRDAAPFINAALGCWRTSMTSKGLSCLSHRWPTASLASRHLFPRLRF